MPRQARQECRRCALLGECVQPCRWVIFGEVVSAVDAIKVGDARRAMAVPAAWSHLVRTLRAKVVFTVDAASTRRAKGHHRQARRC
jgi:hypothetical protein